MSDCTNTNTEFAIYAKITKTGFIYVSMLCSGENLKARLWRQWKIL